MSEVQALICNVSYQYLLPFVCLNHFNRNQVLVLGQNNLSFGHRTLWPLLTALRSESGVQVCLLVVQDSSRSLQEKNLSVWAPTYNYSFIQLHSKLLSLEPKRIHLCIHATIFERALMVYCVFPELHQLCRLYLSYCWQ